MADPLLERIARRERWLVWAGLALVAVTGIVATLRTGDMLMMASPARLGLAAYAALLFLMWWTMMMAMMLPSAAPAILTFGALNRNFARKGAAPAQLGAFVAGYAVVWTVFSVVAVLLQLLTWDVFPLTMMMATTSAVLGGLLLLAAGIYQLTPLKAACLRNCQSPLIFLGRHWQPGNTGAWAMGLRHGVYCVGCCWVLMGLLFYGGVMELRWIVGLALYVAVEKFLPAGNRLSQFTGLLLLGWGAWVIYRAI